MPKIILLGAKKLLVASNKWHNRNSMSCVYLTSILTQTESLSATICDIKLNMKWNDKPKLSYMSKKNKYILFQ